MTEKSAQELLSVWLPAVLRQAQDRFAAGVTNNIEVIQAQEALATTNDNYINSLLAHNLAKLSLARALGVAEEATKEFLGGTQ
jgi:outer membrane protein TolC